jgi:phage FluMu gp28-like protein
VARPVLDEADQACARLSLGRDGVRKADLSGVWVSAGVSLS